MKIVVVLLKVFLIMWTSGRKAGLVWEGLANGEQTDALDFTPRLLACGFTELSSLLLESLGRGGSVSWQLPPRYMDREHHTGVGCTMYSPGRNETK